MRLQDLEKMVQTYFEIEKVSIMRHSDGELLTVDTFADRNGFLPLVVDKISLLSTMAGLSGGLDHFWIQEDPETLIGFSLVEISEAGCDGNHLIVAFLALHVLETARLISAARKRPGHPEKVLYLETIAEPWGMREVVPDLTLLGAAGYEDETPDASFFQSVSRSL